MNTISIYKYYINHQISSSNDQTYFLTNKWFEECCKYCFIFSLFSWTIWNTDQLIKWLTKIMTNWLSKLGLLLYWSNICLADFCKNFFHSRLGNKTVQWGVVGCFVLTELWNITLTHWTLDLRMLQNRTSGLPQQLPRIMWNVLVARQNWRIKWTLKKTKKTLRPIERGWGKNPLIYYSALYKIKIYKSRL